MVFQNLTNQRVQRSVKRFAFIARQKCAPLFTPADAWRYDAVYTSIGVSMRGPIYD
jgi:hypothetical protein